MIKRDSASSAELRQHVIDLCRAFDVELTEVPGLDNARATTEFVHNLRVSSDGRRKFVESIEETRKLLVMPIVDDFTYAIAMHELGHILHPGGRLIKRRPDGQLYPGQIATAIEEEENAWAWAMHHSLIWSMRCQDALDFGMKSYLRAA